MQHDLDHSFPGQAFLKWFCSVLASLAMLAAALVKIIPSAALTQASNMMHVETATISWLGVLILCGLLLYWIPRGALFGTIWLTGYLGGAMAYSWLVMKAPPTLPAALIVLLWVGFALRYPRAMSALGLAPASATDIHVRT